MNAILLAGGEQHSGDPLYQVSRGRLRAMLEVGGKPMVQWVLTALDQARNIEQIVVVGLPPETSLECSRPLIFLEDQGSTRKNILAGAQQIMAIDALATHAILATDETPAIRPEMVDWLIEQVIDQENDIDYTVIERSTMEAVFPQAQKTYMHLKDMDVCGGDLHCIRLGFALQEHALWDRLIAGRQSPLRQASLLGYDTVFILMLRQMSLHQAEQRVSKRLDIQGHALLSPFPEMGFDVNKPAHYDIVQEYFAHIAAAAEKTTPLPRPETHEDE
jgi:molybdopterin-guanine dinucleotide biosynthesis protein A